MEREPDHFSPAGGLVRGRRRPAGWSAPGPAPRIPADRSGLWPRADEDLCWLAGDWRILQLTQGHRFSVDDLLTAHQAVLALGQSPRRILDLGCGIGSVLLFLAWRFPQAEVVGIEAQERSAEMARRSIAWNGVGDRCQVRVGDFRDPAVRDALGTVDLVTGTPPYFPPGTGIESELAQRGPCRFEHRGGIEAYGAAASDHLAPQAPLVLCASPVQTARLEAWAPTGGLDVCSRRDVIPKAGKPSLFSLYVLRRAEQGHSPLPPARKPPLVVRDAADRRTAECEAIRVAMGLPPRPGPAGAPS